MHDAGLGEPGCCSECKLPFVPSEEQVSAWSYALWDTALGAVRGATVFTAWCSNCRVPLAARPEAVSWSALDPRAVRWQRDGHYHCIGSGPDA